MRREDVERTLREAGWKKTLAAPSTVVDYQTSKPFYNRIILYPWQINRITEEALRELMATSPIGEERVKVMRKYDI